MYPENRIDFWLQQVGRVSPQSALARLLAPGAPYFSIFHAASNSASISGFGPASLVRPLSS